jgi:laminin, gamma 1
MELIQIEGVSELQRAKNKSNQFDHQSDQMSDISRNARKIAEDLEKAAEANKDKAKEAKERAINASDIAKNTIDLQRTLTDQIKTKIAPDFPKEKEKLESLKKLTAGSLEKANTVYDESLTLFAKINALPIPELDLNPIKEDSAKLSKAADDINAELDEVLTTNLELLSGLEEDIDFSKTLIDR